jgi:Transposase DDE domain
LALVAGQDVEPGDGPGRWWIAERTVGDRVISTVDPEARHAHETRRAYRDGYKVHVAAEPDTGLVTACDIGPGNAGDAEAAPDLIAQEPAGTEVLGDSAYSAGEFHAHLRDREMTAVIKPPPLRPAVAGGFSLDDFIIDTTAGTVTCPEGVTVTITPLQALSHLVEFSPHLLSDPLAIRASFEHPQQRWLVAHHPRHDVGMIDAKPQSDTSPIRVGNDVRRGDVQRFDEGGCDIVTNRSGFRLSVAFAVTPAVVTDDTERGSQTGNDQQPRLAHHP